MNLLLALLAIVCGLIALVLVIALFTPKSYTVAREIIVNKPRQDVFNYIRYLKNQDHFSKWVMMDPNMKKEFRGTDGTVGFVYAWDGNKQAGKGEQEIKAITEGERLDVEIRFEKPFEGIAHAPFITEPLSASETRIKWGMSSSMKYPMNIMLLLGIEKMLGKDLELSLNNLKIRLENSIEK